MQRYQENIFNYLIGFICLIGLTACQPHRNTAQGYVEGRYTYITSQVGGKLEQLAVARGSPVTVNQFLFQLETDPELSQLNQAKAQLTEAESNLADLLKGKRPSELAAIKAQQKQTIAQITLAKKTVARYDALYKKGFIDKQSLDQSVSNLQNLEQKLSEITENLKTAKLEARIDLIRAAESRVKATTANVAALEWQIRQKQILAPAAGTVFDTYFRIGEIVAANQPVLSLLAPENVYLVFYVPEKDLSQIKLNQLIHFTCDSCSSELNATIDFISPEAEYTPPVIYSEKTREKLIYRVEGRLTPVIAKTMHPGQPITVYYG